MSSIAFKEVKPAVDGNVIRALSRIKAIHNHPNGSTEMTRLTNTIAQQLVDEEDPGSFNQGMMELGATVCTPTSPSCETSCPIKNHCAAFRLVKIKRKYSQEKEIMDGVGSNDSKGTPSNQPTLLSMFSLSQSSQELSQTSSSQDSSQISILDLQEDEQKTEISSTTTTTIDVESLPSEVTIFPIKKKKRFSFKLLS